MIQCWKSLQAVTRSKWGTSLKQSADKSGMSLSSESFGKCSHTQSTFCNACHLCRCLAHIINLATQAVISTHSKAQFCAGNPGDDHLPEDVGGTERDEIGIIRAICVKVCSTPLLSLGP